jgi:hypothetical protein
MRSKFIVLGIVGLCLVNLVGCATTSKPKGPSDEELISGVMNGVLEALKAGDVEKMMTGYADNFSSEQGDKAAMQAFLQGAKDQGALQGITASTEGMAITVEGEMAKVAPVVVEGMFGQLTLAFELAKQDGTWMITKQSQQ